MSLGLDGVVAAETVLSHVDGEAGRLIVRGFDLEDIAGLNFEAMCALLWDGLAPGPLGEGAVKAALGAARVRAFAIGAPLLPQTAGLSPVEGLRLLLSALPDSETTPHHVLAVAAVPVFAAMVVRHGKGFKPVPPDATAAHVADFLAMMRGTKPSPQHARALETYIVTVADHGLNASTFTARVIASTRAGLLSAVVGASVRAEGPAARRRAGAGARHARRDRRRGQYRAVARGGHRARRPADGLRPPRLSRARSARRRAEAR